MTLMTYWSISSQLLLEAAQKMWLKTEILIPEKNFFIIKSDKKEVVFKSTDFGENSSLWLKIANDKEMSYEILSYQWFIVPKTAYVSYNEYDSFDFSIFSEFHFPLVVKPLDGAHWDGVKMHILTIEELRNALYESFQKYPKMIVQEEVQWDEVRVLVVKDEVVLAINRIPPIITGNAKNTIRELIEKENSENELRWEQYTAPLSYIKIDSELESFILKQGYSLDDTLPKGIKLQVRWNSNLGSGGTLKRVTELLHPDTQKMCIQIAKNLWLSICGIDILIKNLSLPFTRDNGVILEINATPWLQSAELTSVNSAEIILQKIFQL